MSIFLVSTRCWGVQSQCATLSNNPQSGQHEFPRSIWERGKFFLLLMLIAVFNPCAAQVTLDGSMGIAGTFPGSPYQIYQQYGHTVGSNLFHSFGVFNINSGESATFYATPAIQNIIGRVTGGSYSTINGALNTANTDANLWLINPSGFVFGPNASINVNGSFYVSTANTLKFADGSVFDTTHATPPVLTTAAPEAFGFLGNNPAPVYFFGSSLSVPEGKTFAVVGGDVHVQAWQSASGKITPSNLQTPSGKMEIVSMASNGEINPNNPPADMAKFAQAGNITVSQASVITASGQNEGNLVIRGGQLVMDNAQIVSNNSSSVDAKSIDIAVNDKISMNHQAGISSQTTGSGKGAVINAQANNLSLENSSGIASDTQGAGEGGAINLNISGNLTMKTQSGIITASEYSGLGGKLSITANDLALDNGTIRSYALAGGQGGDIDITASTVELTSGGQVSINSSKTGNTGQMNVIADAISMDGLSPDKKSFSGFSSNIFGSGNGSPMSIQANYFLMGSNNASIRTNTLASSSGSGSPFSLKTDYLSLIQSSIQSNATGTHLKTGAGQGGAITIVAKNMDLFNLSYITSASTSNEAGGSLNLQDSGQISLASGSYIGTDSESSGFGGLISILANKLVLDNAAHVKSYTNSSGQGGDIAIEAGSLNLTKGANISSVPNDTGAGGAIKIHTSGQTSLDSGSFIETDSSPSSGVGGALTLSTNDLVLNNQSSVTSATPGIGQGGDLTINANNLKMSYLSYINSFSNGKGSGGAINILASGQIKLGTFSYLKTDTEVSGLGGKLSISANDLSLDTQSYIKSITNGTGQGGDIAIQANNLNLGNSSYIFSVSKSEGTGGAINIQTSGKTDIESGSYIETDSVSSGLGGNLYLLMKDVVLNNGVWVASAALGSGQGGAIAVKTNSLNFTNFSHINSLAKDAGAGGAITLYAPGQINLSSGSFLRTESDSPGLGGNLSILAGDVALDNAAIQSNAQGVGKGGDIVIEASNLNLTHLSNLYNPANITSDTTNSGAGGEINIQTSGQTSLASGSYIVTDNEFYGLGGKLSLTANDLVLNNAFVQANARGFVQGGDINIRTSSFELSNGGQVSIGSTSSGDTGQLNVQADKLVLQGSPDGSIISGFMSKVSGSGNGNAITINAKAYSATDYGLISSSTNATSTGDGSNINVMTDSLVLDKAAIVSGTSGGGKAGNINVNATGYISVTGTQDNTKLGGIYSNTDKGNAGNILVTAPEIDLNNNAHILSTTFGLAKAGDITLSASGTNVNVDNSIIGSQSLDNVNSGNAGDIVINANSVININNNSNIGSLPNENSSPDTSSIFGNAGKMVMTASDAININNSFVNATTLGIGKAGDINIATNGQVNVNNSQIDSNTLGAGDAGNLDIQAGNSINVSNGSLLTSVTFGVGSAGAVVLNAGQAISVSKMSVVSSDSLFKLPSGMTIDQIGDKGKAGQVTVTSDKIWISDGSKIGAETTDGKGGMITAQANDIYLDSGGRISTGTWGNGVAGNITISNPEGHAVNLVSINGVKDDFSGTLPDGQKVNGQFSGIFLSTMGAGNGGSLNLATHQLNILDGGVIKATTAYGANENTLGGDINILADSVQITGGGEITAATSGAGKAGDVVLTATDSVSISGVFNRSLHPSVTNPRVSENSGIDNSATYILDPAAKQLGAAGSIVLNTGNLSVFDGGEISTNNEGSGVGGSVSINAAQAMLISQSAFVGSKSSYTAPTGETSAQIGNNGKAGQVTLTSEKITVSDGGKVDAGTVDGKGGTITLQTNELNLDNGGVISTSTSIKGKGVAGDIAISNRNGLASKLVSINGVKSGVLLDTQGTGNGGNLAINTSQLSLQNSGAISATTSGASETTQGGTINIQADSVLVTGGGGISATASALGKAGDINLTATNQLTVSDKGSKIEAQTAEGTGGMITIKTPDLYLANGGSISTSTTGKGNAGGITISNLNGQASNLVSIDGAGSGILLDTIGAGNGGNLDINTSQLSIQNSGAISATTSGASKNTQGGTLNIQADSVLVTGGGGISATASAFGKAGDITLTATNQLTVSDKGSRLEAQTADGTGGMIMVKTPDLYLANGGSISTSTSGKGSAGDITISNLNGLASNLVSINGANSGISLDSSATGNGGSLDVTTKQLFVQDGGAISAKTTGAANEQTKGGNIHIQADSVLLAGGGEISAATSGAGKAGDVTLTATGAVIITGAFNHALHHDIINTNISDQSGINNSASYSLNSGAQALGTGGSIKLTSGSLSLLDGGEISVSNAGSGVGGSITINAGANFYSNNGHISATTASANGGDIRLNARQMIHLINSSISTSVAGGTGSGGNIWIDPQFVILDNSQITAQALEGAGGKITIVADQFIQSGDSIVSASSRFGVNGNVIISSPDTNMVGKIPTLTARYLDASTLFKEQCAARYAAGPSSLEVHVSNTIKPAPGTGYFMASYDQVARQEAKGSCSAMIH